MIQISRFANNSTRYDEDLELLGELIQGCLEEEGYKVKNFMDTTTSTTAYGGMKIQLYDGRVVSLTYDLSYDRN